jgi:hypothetical protein
MHAKHTHTHTHTHLTRNYECGHIYQDFIITPHYYIVQGGPRKSSPPSVLHMSLWYSLCHQYVYCIDVRSCVLMQEATTFTIFYYGLSFQHLATVLIAVFTLYCGPRLPFRGLLCILSLNDS